MGNGIARTRLAVAAITVAALTALAPASAQATFSITAFTASPSSAPAGSHPDSTVSMSFGGNADEDVRDIIQHFPAGIIPNPEALDKCTLTQLQLDACPPTSRLGPTSLTATPEIPLGMTSTSNGDVYNIQFTDTRTGRKCTIDPFIRNG